MLDMTTVIAPKSDQLNSDDLITGPRTIKITKVIGADSKEQPISIFFDGDNGKPYKPCLSMRRALVHVWGKNGLDYVGRYITIYRDPEVIYGGVKTGGIRISHMSHITEPKTFALAANKQQRKPYTVKPIIIEQKPPAAATKGE